MTLRHFRSRVAGVSWRNADGSSRQEALVRCRLGEPLRLEPEPDNPHDINAIRVLRSTGEQLGYLPRELAGQIVSRTAKGEHYCAYVQGIGRTSGGYGASLLIVVDDHDEATDEEFTAYAHRVFEEQRPAREVEPWVLSHERALVERNWPPSIPEPEPHASRSWAAIAVGVAIVLAVTFGAIVLSR